MGWGEERLASIEVLQAAKSFLGPIEPDHPPMRDRQPPELGYIHLFAAEAFWRIPGFLLCSGSGMALGGWLAGVLYDHFGTYAVAFSAGVAANAINLAIVGTLVIRQKSRPAPTGR